MPERKSWDPRCRTAPHCSFALVAAPCSPWRLLNSLLAALAAPANLRFGWLNPPCPSQPPYSWLPWRAIPVDHPKVRIRGNRTPEPVRCRTTCWCASRSFPPRPAALRNNRLVRVPVAPCLGLPPASSSSSFAPPGDDLFGAHRPGPTRSTRTRSTTAPQDRPKGAHPEAFAAPRSPRGPPMVRIPARRPPAPLSGSFALGGLARPRQPST